MKNNRPTKFGDNTCCGIGDIFLVVEEQVSACSLNSATTEYLQGKSNESAWRAILALITRA